MAARIARGLRAARRPWIVVVGLLYLAGDLWCIVNPQKYSKQKELFFEACERMSNESGTQGITIFQQDIWKRQGSEQKGRFWELLFALRKEGIIEFKKRTKLVTYAIINLLKTEKVKSNSMVCHLKDDACFIKFCDMSIEYEGERGKLIYFFYKHREVQLYNQIKKELGNRTSAAIRKDIRAINARWKKQMRDVTSTPIIAVIEDEDQTSRLKYQWGL
jgi:hypothetical protein